jgi:hypothetical protein
MDTVSTMRSGMFDGIEEAIIEMLVANQDL